MFQNGMREGKRRRWDENWKVRRGEVKKKKKKKKTKKKKKKTPWRAFEANAARRAVGR